MIHPLKQKELQSNMTKNSIVLLFKIWLIDTVLR